jgi:cobalt/nickel transport system ATP-binding protein
MYPIIEINHLSFAYPDGKQALQDICLKIDAGEKVAVVGANGAGKSTLLLHCNGVLDGSGRVSVKGLEMVKDNLGRIRTLVGLVFQNPDDQLFSPTVFEDVAYGPRYQGLDKETIRERVAQALIAVGMQEFADRNPYHLSNGEKKRIAIATVLSMLPEVLVFDEPTAGLDARGRRELIEVLRALPQTMLIATHDLGLAECLTPRTIVLDEGKIVADGLTAQILADARMLEIHGLR